MLLRGQSILRVLTLFATVVTLSSCATWYQRSQQFQASVTAGDFGQAQKIIEKSKKESKGKNRFLYFANAGWLNRMTGDADTSNYWLNQADLYVEDYQKNLGAEALALVTNPNVKPYAPEDPEKVMVNFYKALNFAEEGNMEAALVEARRVNIRLQELNDKYKKKKNRYSNDAFAHLLMGLLYEASNDHNNAFIAYRNALEVYDSLYTPQFGIKAPLQLKQDLLRSAWLNGFNDELQHLEKKLNTSYEHQPLGDNGQVVFIWENGFGPVKDEWSINFSVIRGSGGMVTFQSSELGISFPFFLTDLGSGSSSLTDLDFIRVAFPQYLIRKPLYSTATLQSSKSTARLEKAQDISHLLVKSLRDRMVREMANSLLRLAAKKSLEAVARDQDKTLGFLFSIFNALTEQADTRNWQTLPAEIFYTRMVLPAGKQTLLFTASDKNGQSQTRSLEVNIRKGRTTFVSFRSLESGFPSPVPASMQ